MPVEAPSLFTHVIEDHLRLKARNADLEDTLPLQRYMAGDPFHNHPLFKTEEQARIEETMDGETPLAREADSLWPGEDTGEVVLPEADDTLWGRSRDFDWGD
jgi:hypothetical protein